MPDAVTKQVPTWVVVAAAAAMVGVVAAVALVLRAPPTEDADASAPRPPMRVHLFVDPAKVIHEPRFQFTFDSPAVLADLRREEHLDEVVAGAKGDLEAFRALNSWTRRQFEPGVPDPYPPFYARIILRDVRRGFTGGFCAQYNFVLGQALMALGYPVRFVTVHHHEVLEAWLRQERRWICLDPLHAATYVDETGRPLSVLEIATRARRGEDPVPGPGSLPGTAEAVRDAFGLFAVWLRNDLVTHPMNFTDIETYKVHFLLEGQTAPEGALSTSFPEDLYFDPES